MQWAVLFVFNEIDSAKFDELVAIIERSDVIWIFAHFSYVAEALRLIREKLKSKIIVAYREYVILSEVKHRNKELELFVDEFAPLCDSIFIHLPRDRIMWSSLLTRYPVIRSGIVVPLAINSIYDYKRELRFIHYRQLDKWWKGTDIVERLLHLPHIIVGFGEGAMQVSYSNVLQLQAASELVVHPTRVDAFSRFLMSGMLLGCVPVLLMTDAQLLFVLANASTTDKREIYNVLRNHFSVHWDADSFCAAVEELMRNRELIWFYRDKLREYLLQNADLWSPEIIYQQFADHGLKLPADLIPVTLIAHFKEDESTKVVPQGRWTENPKSLVFHN
ncbi:hypothetical protein GG496_000190 [Candidatus Fervidibacteria bacterium JGI MDM2 JNZ-1-D12]